MDPPPELSTDLTDLYASIEICIRLHLYHREDIYPRLVRWAIAVLNAHGCSAQLIAQSVGDRPPEKQWWAVRTLLPESALYALERHLKAKNSHQGS